MPNQPILQTGPTSRHSEARSGVSRYHDSDKVTHGDSRPLPLRPPVLHIR
jgi:hypothetical protein